MNAAYYAIKEFADIFQTTEHTVRYYTDIGILPCQRDGGRRRVFDEESVNWMQGIACLKGCGASIEAILAGELPDDTNPASWAEDSRPKRRWFRTSQTSINNCITVDENEWYSYGLK